MKKTNRLLVGSAFGLAAIAVAIDHTQHRLPEPVAASQEQVEISDEESPCGMGATVPCSMDVEIINEDDNESPCSMSSDSSPCGLGD